MPLFNVSSALFFTYAFITSTSSDEGQGEVSESIRISFAIIFPLYLILGFMLSSGVFSDTPMRDKKSGMRQMLSTIGVKSGPYFTGLFMADFIVALMPNFVFTVILLCMNGYLMDPVFVLQWTPVYMFFACSLINLAYLIHHLFDDPETSIKYTGLLVLLVTLLLPLVISLLVAACFKFEKSWNESLYMWFFLDPVLTFGAISYNFCIR